MDPLAINTPIEQIDPETLDRLQIRDSAEIISTLRKLLRDQSTITAYPSADTFLNTQILEVLPEKAQITLDLSALNTEILQAQQLIRPEKPWLMVGMQHRIKLQFHSQPLELIEFEGNPACSASLPQTIVKLQRRAYFRIPLPLLNPALCTLLPGDSKNSTYTILDIGLGGVGILGFDPNQYDPSQSSLFPNCQLSLPETGIIVASLQLKNHAKIKLANGKESSRSGFSFVGLKPPMEHLISRFIMKLEREQKSLR